MCHRIKARHSQMDARSAKKLDFLWSHTNEITCNVGLSEDLNPETSRSTSFIKQTLIFTGVKDEEKSLLLCCCATVNYPKMTVHGDRIWTGRWSSLLVLNTFILPWPFRTVLSLHLFCQTQEKKKKLERVSRCLPEKKVVPICVYLKWH